MIEALLDMLKKESIILFFYIHNVIFTAILFDVLGVKRVYSLIPIYNVYRLYKEYQGRVWKKNWGVLYNIIFIIVTLCVFSYFNYINNIFFRTINYYSNTCN